MTAPTTLRAGDSASWSTDLPTYPAADGWSLHHRLLWQTATPVDISTTADSSGTSYTATVSATVSATFTAGAATLVSWVTGPDSQRITLGRATVTILPDLTTAQRFDPLAAGQVQPDDPRTANQIALANARLALANYVQSGRTHVAEYTINGRSMKFRSAADIQELIRFYEREVARDNALTALMQGQASGRIRIRM